MDAFDLNIDNYTIDELEDFFMLGRSAGVPIYDTGNVDQKRSMLLNKLTSDPSLPHSLKIGIKTFLEQAGQRIVGYINGASGSVSGGHISAMYNPYSAVAPLSNTQSPQAGSAAFTGLQNTVVQQGSHFLIQNPSAMNQQQQQQQQHPSFLSQQSSLQAGSTEFQGSGTGVVNPIQRRTIKRALNIDTRFRPNYNSTKSTDVQISLPYRFEKVIGLRIAAVEMPLTYYAISADNGNNVFRVDWVDNVTDSASPVARSNVVTVPDGNYETVFTSNSDTRNTTIESAINALLKETPHGNAPLYLRFTVDRTSGRSIFAQDISGAAHAIPFTITFNVDPSGRTVEQAALPLYLGWSLGFRGAVYNRSGATSSASAQTTATAIISEGTCCIRGPQYAFIAIDDYNNSVNNYFISAYKDSVASPNVVARLNLTQIQQCGQVYQMGQDDGVSNQMDFRSRTYFGPVDIQKMRVTVFDEFGRIINLNNMDWSMAILFECMYE